MNTSSKSTLVERIIRENIKNLTPYSSARDEYSGSNAIFLDANENPFNNPYNRYPDPHQQELKYEIANIKKVVHTQLFLGNGSDEAIDLLIRAFCEPGKDNILIPDPTYGMYNVCAQINNIEVRTVSLTCDFQLDVSAMLEASDKNTKLIFICSPNNPTSNSFSREDVIALLNGFKNGLVIIDEAYIDFSMQKSFLRDLPEFENLVILQTFSKAWGLAGLRLGLAIASKEIVQVLSKIKYPYNVNSATQQIVLDAIRDTSNKNYWVQKILQQRRFLENELTKFSFIERIYPSDANFLMLKVSAPQNIFKYLVQQKIIIRDRSRVHLCLNCLRVTVGSEKENHALIDSMHKYENILNSAKQKENGDL